MKLVVGISKISLVQISSLCQDLIQALLLLYFYYIYYILYFILYSYTEQPTFLMLEIIIILIIL